MASGTIASSLVVLSPHRDDAAFSAACLLAQAAAAGLPTTILNLFTRSAYAPFQTDDLSPKAISALRLAEDQAVLAALGHSVHLQDLGLLDAPLRLGIPDTSVLSNPLSPEAFAAEVTSIAAGLPALAPSAVLALPLSIGNHIDHRIGRDAGLRIASPDRVVFYQDLPYASRISAQDLAAETRDLLSGLEALTHTSLHSTLLRSPNAANLKRQLASLYPSQIAPDTVSEMSTWSGALGGEILFLSAPSQQALQALLPHADLIPVSETSPA